MKTNDKQYMRDCPWGSGYLSPEGEFFHVGYQNHRRASFKLLQQFYPDRTEDEWESEDAIDRLGWLKLSSGSLMYYGRDHEITAAQLAQVKEWIAARNEHSTFHFNMRPEYTWERLLQWAQDEIEFNRKYRNK